MSKLTDDELALGGEACLNGRQPDAEDIDEHAERVHAAISETAQVSDNSFDKPDPEDTKPGTPKYESHKKQLARVKDPAATAELSNVDATAKLSSPTQGGTSTPPPLSNRSQRGKYSFETFGVEPIGKNSWRLDSPRSLKSCYTLGIAVDELRPRPMESFHSKGVHPEVAKLRFNNYEEQRKVYLERCKQHWQDALDQAATQKIKSPPGTTAFNMYKAANARLNQGAKKRAKMLRNYQVSSFKKYVEDVTQQDNEAQSDQAEKEAERLRQKKARETKAAMAAMRRAQDEAAEERRMKDLAAKMREEALEEKKEKEAQALAEKLAQQDRQQKIVEAQQRMAAQIREREEELAKRKRDSEAEMARRDAERIAEVERVKAERKAENDRKRKIAKQRIADALREKEAALQKIRDDFAAKQEHLGKLAYEKELQDAEDAESNRRRLEGKNRRAHEKLMAARKKEADFKASIKKQHEDHEEHMRQRKEREDFENLLKKTERDLKLEQKRTHALHTAQAEKYRVKMMAEEQDEVRRRLDNLDQSQRKMLAGRQLFLQKVKRNRDDLAENLHHIKVMNKFEKLDAIEKSPTSTHSNLPPISPPPGTKTRSFSTSPNKTSKHSKTRSKSTPPSQEELVARVERLEKQLSASQKLAQELGMPWAEDKVPVGNVNKGLSRETTPPAGR